MASCKKSMFPQTVTAEQKLRSDLSWSLDMPTALRLFHAGPIKCFNPAAVLRSQTLDGKLGFEKKNPNFDIYLKYACKDTDELTLKKSFHTLPAF